VTTALSAQRLPFDVERVRRDFPGLDQTVHGKPLVYLDNGATAQVPQCVLDAMQGFHRDYRANVHRGIHQLSATATAAYDAVRGKVARYLNAASESEIVFTRGTTESINLVASTFGRANLGPGDEVVVSQMEHHSNIVPWQILCEEKGARLRVIPMNERGELDMEHFASLLNERTRLVSVVHTSNALGTINPVRQILDLSHARGIPVLLDGAQAVPHGPVDLQALDCDFFAFSAHKLFGPTGVGVLYGKRALLDEMPPYQGGGDMIESVSFAGTTYAEPPHKFEAGTPNIGGVIGLGAAIDYLEELDWSGAVAHEADLLQYATEKLSEIAGLRLVGTAVNKVAVLSFVMDCAHPHDIAAILDQEGIAVRTGHHCAEPVMDFFGISGTARASLSFYNTREDVDRLYSGLQTVVSLFG